jgi:hypothetical protein
MRNGVPLDQIYGAKGAHTAAATGCMQNGNDLCNLLLDIIDGNALGFNVGLAKNGTDFSSIFGAPVTSLPIQGEQFNSVPTFAGGISTSFLDFNCNNATWSVTGSYSNTSGSIPSGATQCEVTPTYQSGSTGTSITNQMALFTTLTSTTYTCQLHLSSSQSSPINAVYGMMVQFKNSAGSVISTTTFTFYMNTAAS